MTPSLARQSLEQGNERFLKGQMVNRDLMQQVDDTRGGQWPFAVVLGCIDSRVSNEIIFDQGIGDIFSARVAGNFVNDDILGSMEFGCKVAGAKLIVVLGHKHCGAIKGACDNVELGNLTSLLANLKPAVAATSEPQDPTQRTSANPDFVQAVALENIRQTVRAISERSPVLAAMRDAGEIDIVGCMYDVESGEISFLD